MVTPNRSSPSWLHHAGSRSIAAAGILLAAALAELLSVSAEKKVPVRVSAVRKINAQREKAG